MHSFGEKRVVFLPFLVLLALVSNIYANEVYLSSITIFKKHDRFIPPTVYFKCVGDNRGKAYLSDVKATNHAYVFAQESMALTHVAPDGCREQCGIYDKDYLDTDDLFGQLFKVCDTSFDPVTKIHTTTVPGEVILELYCPQCHHIAPPPPPEVQTVGPPSPVQTSEQDVKEDRVHKKMDLKNILIALLVAAVTTGFCLGFIVHKMCRAFSDVAAEDARSRFQALYADPTTDIEDLPAVHHQNRPSMWHTFARNTRRLWTRTSPTSSGAPASTVPRPAVPLQQLKVSEEDLDEA